MSHSASSSSRVGSGNTSNPSHILSFAPDSKSNDASCLEADMGRMMLQQLATSRRPNVEMVIMWTDRVRAATERCEASRRL